MTHLDRFYIACLWTALAIATGMGRRAYEDGLRRGRAEAWTEATDLIMDHRTRYDPEPVGKSEEQRRRAMFGPGRPLGR